MKFAIVSPKLISTSERAREELGNLEELVTSLKSKIGQIQSLAVQETGDPTSPYRLLAGGRRLAAIQLAEIPEVGIRIYEHDELDKIDLLTVELQENLCRLDLSWVESCRLTERIHELQCEKHGGEKHHKHDEGWSQADTARLIGFSASTVGNKLQMAKMLKATPELEKIKDRRKAENAIAKLRERLVLEELSRRAAEKPPEVSDIVYSLGDTLELLPGLPADSYDIIDLDPDYGIAFSDYSSSVGSGGARPAAKIAKATYQTYGGGDYGEYIRPILEQCYRLLKHDRWLILWHGYEFSTMLDVILTEIGFKSNPVPAIWCKAKDCEIRTSAAPDTSLGNMYETFTYARKGTAIITKRARANVFHFPTPPSLSRGHPAEKPVELMKEILETFSHPGASILVPFAGSGNTLLAAKSIGMKALGFDSSAEYQGRFLVKTGGVE